MSGSRGFNLRALEVRLIRGGERSRFCELIDQHHYLGYEPIIGESLCYVATHEQQWVALLGWGSAALKCTVRDRWIGWEREQQWRRLSLIVNNVRYLILPGANQANLASRVLALNLKRLSQDWQSHHGHPIVLAETFVDGARFSGVCYRAAGFEVLGSTRGFAKRNRRYWYHGQTKLVLVRPLRADARRYLSSAFLPAKTHSKETPMIVDVNRLPLQGAGGLIEMLGRVVDPRKRRGVRHSVVSIVAISVCAALSGARSFCAIAEWAAGLSREALGQLGVKRGKPPSEPTIRRVLQHLDADSLDRDIGQWLVQTHVLGGRALAVDGKTLRGGYDANKPAPHLLSAILHQEAVVLGQLAVNDKTNEIPKLPELLAPLPLAGAVITADALHTQQQTARFVVEQKKADYLFIAKDNQPTLRQDIAALDLQALPPCTPHHR
jgi:hypothetical protein